MLKNLDSCPGIPADRHLLAGFVRTQTSRMTLPRIPGALLSVEEEGKL